MSTATMLSEQLHIAGVKVHTAAGDVTLTNEGVCVVNKTSGAATQVTLKNPAARGVFKMVKDGKGDAATNNVTVVASSGNIDGLASHVLRKNYGSAVFMWNGTQWNLLSAGEGGGVIAGGASLTLTALHDGKTILMDQASGTALTLPAATGSGVRFRAVVSVTVTSNQHRVSVVGNDAMFGTALLAQDGGDTSVLFEAGADTDRINMNGSTTGGIKGTIIELEDIAADTWFVRLVGAATGTEATPFQTGQVS